jgi:hypothetical protein
MADIDWLPPAKLREHYVDPVAVDAQDAQRVLYLAVITGQVRSRCKGHILRLDQIGAMRDINPFSLPPDCVIRRKAATDSDAIRPSIPTEVGRPYRSKPATLVRPV